MNKVKLASIIMLVWLGLSACAPTSIDFNRFDYVIQQEKLDGHIELIISPAARRQTVTVSAVALGDEEDKTINTGHILTVIASHELGQLFATINTVPNLNAIPPGFYRAIMSLSVASFSANHESVSVEILSKMYSYQGHLLYKKVFKGVGRNRGDLQKAVLAAYRDAMSQIRKQLVQVLYWEQNSKSLNPL